MNQIILTHFLKTGMYTNCGPYSEYFKSLPNDINKLRDIINSQHIHKMDLYRSFLEHKKNDINLTYNWENYRCLDDVLLTTPAMVAELFRLNGKNELLLNNNDPNKKLVITCRYVAVLFASILKAKGIPCRCRSGFAQYIYKDRIVDHWIVQYYDTNLNRWINIDPEFNSTKTFNAYNFDNAEFDWSAETWLKMRENNLHNKELYVNGTKHFGDITFAWSLLMDFHALFHDEINYVTTPVFLYDSKDNLYNVKKETLNELDNLATLMLDVDKNFDKLEDIWQNNKKFRSVASQLNDSRFHLELEKEDFS